MQSRKRLIFLLVVLVAMLVFLTRVMEVGKTGGHSHREQEAAEPVPEEVREELKQQLKLKPLQDVEVVTTSSGLKYQDIKVGTGRRPKPGETVVVNYIGWKTNGQAFDTSLIPGRKPHEFRLGKREVIEGWDEGVGTMKVGGKRRLTIPPKLAYGEMGYPPTIKPNETLIFDVELLEIR